MKLLIITQVIDREHPILGFFHRWVEEFASRCDQVHVICLQKGECSFPKNVTVHSLGKDEGVSRLTYLFRFYKYTWTLRKEYDSVFVHMNQEYVLLSGLLWKVFGKKVMLWRNHYAGNFLTDIAASFCSKIFFTSSASYTSKFIKSQQMPIGIDPKVFKKVIDERKKDSLLFVGRIATSKKIDRIIDALPDILRIKPGSTLTVIGPTDDEEYQERLKKIVTKYALPVTFLGPVSWANLPEMYSKHELCINMSAPGMFDKVIGEALLCECDILTTNNDLHYLLGDRIISDSSKEISEFVGGYRYDDSIVRNLREGIVKDHTLSILIKKILAEVT